MSKMKIVFICGSFEPGHDGVGDYLRRLSLELMSNGIDVAVAAINDRHLKGERETIDAGDANHVAALRIPAELAAENRMKILKRYIAEVNPEWISLQYVAFSFHDKGLDFGLNNMLREIGKGKKWEVMFHEIAVGMYEGASVKEVLWGKVQLYLVKQLLRKLEPVVHTTNTVYLEQLKRMGAKANLLPLFSNIPVVSPEQVQKKLRTKRSEGDTINIVVFGSIYPDAPIESFADQAKVYADLNDVKVKLTIIGRSGAELERWMKIWAEAGLDSESLGKLSEKRISEILTEAEFGIFTTPLSLAEKSGSVAAMRAHGVHLLAVSRDRAYRGIGAIKNLYGISAFDGGALDDFFNGEKDFSYIPSLAGTAKQLVDDLSVDIE